MDTETDTRICLYEPDQNIKLWLYRVNVERGLRQWPDPVAVAEASTLLGDGALTWFLAERCNLASWSDFEIAIQQRFGDNPDTIMARIQHRKQAEDESVQCYADDMHMMFGQTDFPPALKRDLLLQNLKPSLRKAVIRTIPGTMQDVIKNATFLETKLDASAMEKVKAWQQQHDNNNQTSVEKLARAMDRMSLGLKAAANPTSRTPYILY